MNPADPSPSPPPPRAGRPRQDALDDRAGYDVSFLGPLVPMPSPARTSVETVPLPYTHFTVLFRPDRRLAAATAVCVEGRELPEEVPRHETWAYDPRLPREQQAGEEFYRDNSLEHGRLVHRLDPAWGPATEASRAVADTLHYTNAVPRGDGLNRAKRLWQGLESHFLSHTPESERRLAVFTGPVLHDADPPYRGLQVPLRFWKVIAFLQDGVLAATAYVLDQSPDMSRDADRALAGAKPGAPPPLGPFRTYQVPVPDVAELTELELGALPDVDLLQSARTPEERWRRLESYDDIVAQA
ncbi:DNA/RNA non-specific endonuclease [Streptomyces sp. NBC_01216]|uniref:DNA/RNA non-specific endonuclease n=1 Tax=unclassified Streptomyces TaxID=2593676 RepID=UPI002E0F53C3|nr:DNA/RNA non-specific endonuclease [Streptomyces sp. NBC_01216]